MAFVLAFVLAFALALAAAPVVAVAMLAVAVAVAVVIATPQSLQFVEFKFVAFEFLKIYNSAFLKWKFPLILIPCFALLKSSRLREMGTASAHCFHFFV